MQNVIDVTEDTFDEEVLQRSINIPVVVDFWAPWCGPCKMLSPVLEKLANGDLYDFVLAKINVDENPNISMQFQVQGIPAVMAFIDGEIVDSFIGNQPESKVREFLAGLIHTELDELMGEGNSLLAIRQWELAEELFRDILQQYPNHQPAMVRLAMSMLVQGKGCTAVGYLQDVSDGPELRRAEQLMPLAEFLCQAETGWDEDDDISNEEAQYRQAGNLLSRGNMEAGLDGLLDVLRIDKKFKKGKAHHVILGVFELLGNNHEITQTYRRELATILF